MRMTTELYKHNLNLTPVARTYWLWSIRVPLVTRILLLLVDALEHFKRNLFFINNIWTNVFVLLLLQSQLLQKCQMESVLKIWLKAIGQWSKYEPWIGESPLSRWDSVNVVRYMGSHFVVTSKRLLCIY